MTSVETWLWTDSALSQLGVEASPGGSEAGIPWVPGCLQEAGNLLLTLDLHNDTTAEGKASSVKTVVKLLKVCFK